MTDEGGEALALARQVSKLFQGRDPMIVAAALADLHAMLLAGYEGENIREIREELLQLHVESVRRMIPVNEMMFADVGRVQ